VSAVTGYRDPNEKRLPDVTMTGDEYLHLLAIQGETIAGEPAVHFASGVPLGMRSPGCRCCQAIQDRAVAFLDRLDREGLSR